MGKIGLRNVFTQFIVEFSEAGLLTMKKTDRSENNENSDC